MMNFRNLKAVLFYSTGLAVMLLASCSQHKSSNQNRALNEISKKFSRSLQKDPDLTIIGTGSDGLDLIEKIAVTIQSHKRLSQEAARSLITSCTQELINIINTDPSIKPFLSTHPYTADNINLSIIFLGENGQFVDQKFVASGRVADGFITLSQCNAQTRELECLSKTPYPPLGNTR